MKSLITEIATTGGILVMIGIIMRWLWARITKLEKKHCKDLYNSNHQPIYMTEERCDHAKDEFITKVDEIKGLIILMDQKRESAKDQFTQGQLKIESRLTAIETKLP